MYIDPQEITTHLNAETIEAISDGDDTLLTAAIDAAVAEAKGYLSAYDSATEFAKEKPETGTDTRNALLVIFIKDMAVWHFINICNVNTDLKLRSKRYDDAKAWFSAVQKGEVKADLPALPSDNVTGIITSSSNDKRVNHY